MQQAPVISIIVPVYNVEEYLHRCIDSILFQTFTDFELLLIDDGSSDGSGKICDEYTSRDARIRVFHKKNGGVCSARNLGLDNAQGEWIAFCDSDDFVTEDWLMIYTEFIGGCDMIVQGLNTDKQLYPLSPPDQRTYGIDFCGDAPSALSVLHNERLVGFTPVRLFRKNIIDKYHLRFNTNFVFKEDLEFILRYMIHCKMVSCTSKAGYFYAVPIWKNKWGDVKLPLELPRSIFQSVRHIFAGRNQITTIYLQEYFQMLLKRMRHGETTRHDIITFRDDTKRDLPASPIFFLSKYIIWLDPTAFVSYIVLKLHSLIKS